MGEHLLFRNETELGGLLDFVSMQCRCSDSESRISPALAVSPHSHFSTSTLPQPSIVAMGRTSNQQRTNGPPSVIAFLG
jgi:hypothetical protein